MDGQIASEEMRKSKLKIDSLTVQISELPNGVYVVTLESSTGESSQQKLVINR